MSVQAIARIRGPLQNAIPNHSPFWGHGPSAFRASLQTAARTRNARRAGSLFLIGVFLRVICAHSLYERSSNCTHHGPTIKCVTKTCPRFGDTISARCTRRCKWWRALGCTPRKNFVRAMQSASPTSREMTEQTTALYTEMMSIFAELNCAMQSVSHTSR